MMPATATSNPRSYMLNRCVSIAIAVCVLTALPIIIFHSFSENTASETEQETAVVGATAEAAEMEISSASARIERVSVFLYGIYGLASLLIISLLIHYVRAYKMALLKSKWMAYSNPKATA